MPRVVLYEWEGLEYSFEEKSADWYWALGIVATAAIVACILFNNILLALVIVAATATLALHTVKRPRMHHYAISDSGVSVDDHTYSYDDILSFSVLEYADPAMPPSLSLRTKHLLASHLLIPIMNYDPVEIFDFFIEHVEEGRHDESIFDRLIALLKL